MHFLSKFQIILYIRVTEQLVLEEFTKFFGMTFFELLYFFIQDSNTAQQMPNL